ncbi:hypothetical protein COCNU_16G000810 [Cocos nucifera]|uniref:Uncharacterized protein n=1 Tax=Cocos nucifera TaxID=13894 RepID=A0A8K0NDQ0_COCNU|nr:hypothetical protein COCNU_16G000810 [Cocos nucifera]
MAVWIPFTTGAIGPDDLWWVALKVGGDLDVEAWLNMEATDEEELEKALSLGEADDHGRGAVGEGTDGGEAREGMEDVGDESLGGGDGEAVGTKDDKASDSAEEGTREVRRSVTRMHKVTKKAVPKE